MTDRELCIVLNLIPELHPARMRRLLEAFGSVQQVCAADESLLAQVEGINAAIAKRIRSSVRSPRLLKEELARANQEGVGLVTLADAAYPRRLREITDPPVALYARGELTEADDAALGIVGSRAASLYGLQVAEQLGYDLALRGATVVSGLALGIDAAAHRGALRAHGRTIAVLGSGFSHVYPTEHAPLADTIAAHGAVVSEYPMQMLPYPGNFPRRNRIISGLSLGVVVVEAGERSGALITADSALEQGREVFAVPGAITASTSAGTHQLLKQGARLVTSVDDILEELHLLPVPVAASRVQQAAGPEGLREEDLSDAERRIASCMTGKEPLYIDAITARCGLATADVSAALLQLELKKIIKQLPGKHFIRYTYERHR